MPQQKSKFVTFVLSFFVPGAGHLYLGLNKRGLQFMIAFFACIAFSWLLTIIFPFVIAVIWFYAMFDALQQTTVVNAWLMGNPAWPKRDGWMDFGGASQSGNQAESHRPFDGDGPTTGDPGSPRLPNDEAPFPWPKSVGSRLDSVWFGIAFVIVGALILLRVVFPQLWRVLSDVHVGSILLALALIVFGVWLIRTQFKSR